MSAEPAAVSSQQSAIRCIWPWLAAATSGALLALSFPPANQGWLAWIALTPLICAVWFGNGHRPTRSSLRILALGYVAGIVFFTATFFWLGELAPLFGNPWLRALPLVLALYMGLYLAFWAWFLGLLVPRNEAGRFLRSSRNLTIGALGAFAWVAQEWVRGWLFSGFGWNTLGVALHADLAMIQVADLTGAAGLSWLAAFGNLMAVLIVRRILAELGPRFLKGIRWEFSVTVALVVAVWAYGTRTLLRRDSKPTVPLRVAAIQSNIPQTEKFDPAAEAKIFAQFDRLTGLALLMQPAPQLVLWPESSTPRGMFADDENYRFVLDQAARSEAALLLGTVEFDPENSEDYNVAALLTQRGERLQIHRKIHLVPFGEYLPLRPVFEPFVGELVPSDFARGRDYTLLELPEPAIKLAALICFEDTVDYLSRRFTAEGAHLLVNITNDGWFGRSAAAEQHLATAVFRAVENRRPLIRCANTGVSCLVTPMGFVERWVPSFEEGISVREIAVPTAATATFFTRHGDVISPGSASITIMAVCVAVFRRRKSRS